MDTTYFHLRHITWCKWPRVETCAGRKNDKKYFQLTNRPVGKFVHKFLVIWVNPHI